MSDQDTNITTVSQALLVLYGQHTDSARRSAANEWLNAFQNEPGAWDVGGTLYSFATENKLRFKCIV